MYRLQDRCIGYIQFKMVVLDILWHLINFILDSVMISAADNSHSRGIYHSHTFTDKGQNKTPQAAKFIPYYNRATPESNLVTWGYDLL